MSDCALSCKKCILPKFHLKPAESFLCFRLKVGQTSKPTDAAEKQNMMTFTFPAAAANRTYGTFRASRFKRYLTYADVFGGISHSRSFTLDSVFGWKSSNVAENEAWKWSGVFFCQAKRVWINVQSTFWRVKRPFFPSDKASPSFHCKVSTFQLRSVFPPEGCITSIRHIEQPSQWNHWRPRGEACLARSLDRWTITPG